MQFNGAGNNKNGVVTRTTPTITPTTMRNIEQFLLEFAPHNQEEMGSFVPPLPICNNIASSSSYAYRSVRSELGTLHGDVNKDSKSNKRATKNKAKKISSQHNHGKRPKMGKNITSQEDERRRQKRERNKLAAAKCRKRRVDHSKSLEEETENLEDKKSQLQGLIAKLQEEKKQLELILSSHSPFCIKSKNCGVSSSIPHKPKRPASLPLNPVKQESLSTPDWKSLLPTGFTPGNSPVITPSTLGNMLTVFGDIS